MKLYRFSPIEDKERLFEAIRYIHFASFGLCKKILGKYLPVAGNIGVFCHYDDEYRFLTKLREDLTEEADNWNKKYYRLHEPIVVPGRGNIPGAVYTYLYIRQPDQHEEVGDVDFVLSAAEFKRLKESLLKGSAIEGLEIFDRPDLDLIRLSDPDIDVLSFIGMKDMAENVKINID
ncbi:MAG: hypothetical protein WC456_03090 [Patescibacteria group bacterium]